MAKNPVLTGKELLYGTIFVIIYLTSILYASVWIAGSIIGIFGISPLSQEGLLYVVSGSAFYLGLEIFVLAKSRPPPFLLIVLVIVISPILVLKGIEVLTREYQRVRQVILMGPRAIYRF